jgi:molybdopterin converting factor small subunit
MKYYVNDHTEIQVSGSTVSQALDDLMIQYPAIKMHILDRQGRLRRHINLFVNREDIKNLEGMETSLNETDTLILMPSITGG